MPNEQRQMIQEITSGAAEATWSKFASKLTNEDNKLDDNKLAAVFLFRERRIALLNLLSYKMQYETTVQEMAEVSALAKKDQDPEREKRLAVEVANLIRQIGSWEKTLRSVLKATEENFAGTIIKDFYGNLDPASGVEGQSAA